MTKVSEEQPQDTFSLFLRHMSIDELSDQWTDSFTELLIHYMWSS